MGAADKDSKLVLLRAVKSGLTKSKSYIDSAISGLAKTVADAIEEHTNNKENPHGVTAAQTGALPLTGGTLTGNLSGKYIIGTWLQSTAGNALTTKPNRICVQDVNGWIYSRTPEQIVGDIGAMERQKSVAITIPTTGWTKDTTFTDYPYRYDIAVTGITENDHVDISIAPGSMADAIACQLCHTNQTLSGKIRVWAKAVPTKAISGEYWLNQGKG